LTGESGDVLTREADPALKELIVECIAPLIAELGEGAASGASDQFRRAFSPGLQEFIGFHLSIELPIDMKLRSLSIFTFLVFVHGPFIWF